MTGKRRDRSRGSRPAAPLAHGKAGAPAADRSRLYMAIGGGMVALVAVIAIVFVVIGTGSKAAPSVSTGETVVTVNGGSYTNVTPDRLAQMMTTKDFTLLNVKTPYIGEIDRTDLYIPYDQLSARAGELPPSKSAKILVYCRSGAESAQAAQTLVSLGYTNVWNLDGGMNAWQSSGRTLVIKNR